MIGRILLVDDHEHTRMALRNMFLRAGADVCGEAQNGREAIDRVQELRPDLVVLDLAMPVMNGVEAAYEIRHLAPSTKIVFFSIFDVPRYLGMTKSLMADGFVSKTDAAGLRREVERLLQPEPLPVG
jgi:DNA-binding NarL/FixJ family response regulator